MSNLEASIRRAEIENNYSWGASNAGGVVKNDPPESVAVEFGDLLVTSFKEEIKQEQPNSLTLNYTRIE
jgi:hypothetical protein